MLEPSAWEVENYQKELNKPIDPEDLDEMEEWYQRMLNPTLADEIREYIGIALMFLAFGLGVIYGHERIWKLLDRILGKECDSQGNPIYPQE